MKKGKKIFVGFLAILIFVGIVALFAALDFDNKWNESSGFGLNWAALVSFRLMLYGLPAIILTPFSKKILKMETV